MKKIAFICVILLLFAGCGRLPAAFAPQRSFTLDFTLYHGDHTIEGSVICNAYEDIRLAFTHPQALSYLTLQIGTETWLADIAGATDTVEARDLPAAAPVRVLAETLRKTVFEQQTFVREAEGFATETEIGGSPVTARFAPDGKISSIHCEPLGVRIDFSE